MAVGIGLAATRPKFVHAYIKIIQYPIALEFQWEYIHIHMQTVCARAFWA